MRCQHTAALGRGWYFGPVTLQRVKEFQTNTFVNGVVDPDDLGKLPG